MLPNTHCAQKYSVSIQYIREQFSILYSSFLSPFSLLVVVHCIFEAQRYELLIRLCSLVFICIVTRFPPSLRCTRGIEEKWKRIESERHKKKLKLMTVCVCVFGVPMFGLRLTKRQLCNLLNLIRFDWEPASQSTLRFQSFIFSRILNNVEKRSALFLFVPLQLYILKFFY